MNRVSIFQEFILAAASIACIVCCFGTSVIFLTRKTEKPIRGVFIYTVSLIVMHSMSAVLIIYMDGKLYDIFLYINIIAGIIVKAAIPLYFGIFTGKKDLIVFLKAINVTAIVFSVLILINPDFKNLIVLTSSAHNTLFVFGTWIFAFISIVLYLIIEFLLLKNKNRYYSKELLVCAMIYMISIQIITLIFLLSKKTVYYDNLTIYIVYALFPFAFLCIPVYDRKKQASRLTDVISGSTSSILFYNSYGSLVFLHNAFENFSLEKYSNDIRQEIRLAASNFKDETKEKPYLEGRINYRDYILEFRYSSISRGKRILGEIIILTDITELVTLYENIAQKNSNLKEAFEMQKKYMVLQKKLMTTEERIEILNKINGIAVAYLGTLKEEIKKMDININNHSIIEEQNEEMLTLTHSTIDRIRRIVHIMNV